MAAPQNQPTLTASSPLATSIQLSWTADAEAVDIEFELKPTVLEPNVNQNATLFYMAPNEAADLGVYECPVGAEDIWPGCGTNTAYGCMVYDDQSHMIYLFGGGHSATYRDDVDGFDFDTLTWAPETAWTPCVDLTPANLDTVNGRFISTNNPVSRHTYDLLCMAGSGANREMFMFASVQGRGSGCNNLGPVDDPLPYVISSSVACAYNITTKTWRYLSNIPGRSFDTGTAYDPVSGKILLVSRFELSTFDPATDTYTTHINNWWYSDFSTGRGVQLIYFPPTDKFYGMSLTAANPGVWEVDFNRANPELSTMTLMTGIDYPQDIGIAEGWVYNAEHQLIMGGVRDGRISAFDPVTGIWHERTMYTTSANAVGTVDNKAIAYDPINSRIIMRTDHGSGRRVWAYRWG